jgi:hypothetical protein
MRSAWFLAAAVFLSGVTAIHADTLQLSVNSSILAPLYSPNDSYWGTYNSAQPQITDFPTVASYVPATFSSVSVLVPAGDVITSAVTRILTPTGAIVGTGVIFNADPMIDQDPPPHIPPTFGSNGTSQIFVNGTYALAPIVDGNEVSTGDLTFDFQYFGSIQDSLTTPGENYIGYLGGSGDVVIPYTVELDVTYSPVPEPSSFALLGTGILTLTGVVRRRL